MVRPEGFEPPTRGLEVLDGISLQYAVVLFLQLRGHVRNYLVGSYRPLLAAIG